jgi:hypothetical protein
MRKLPYNARFLEKAVAPGALCQGGRKELYSDDAPDHRIVRAPDLAIRAGADNVNNLIAAYLHGGLSLR